jgi:N12 class adenine-specific DNA methylase
VLKVVDAEAAKTKLQRIKDEFQGWIWSDPDRTDRLARRFNNIAPRAFDVIFITLEDGHRQSRVLAERLRVQSPLHPFQRA